MIDKSQFHEFTDHAGSFETFEFRKEPGEDDYIQEGWYWWPCFPGCLPDGEPVGPFTSRQEAINDALGQ